jgi:uncharacterized protein related to proFAR isomerase
MKMRRMVSLDQAVKIVPVLDVQGGQVVRAQRGERSAYRPIISALAAGSEPRVLARALLAAAGNDPHEASVMYLADLDAIQGRAVQRQTIAALLAALPQLTLWLDAGFADVPQARALRESLGAAGTRVRPVYGSESITSSAALARIADDPDAILSLDSRAAQPLDPAGCWQQPARWPRCVIVMTLDRVGAGLGPDLGVFESLRRAAPDREWVGAGGLRHAADLTAAAAAGASAWLVASALHDGTLQAAPLQR